MALSKAFVWGDGGAALTPEELAQARLMEARALAKGIDTSPVGHWTQGAARVADAIAGAFRRGALDKAGAANEAYDADLLSSISGAAFPSSVAEGGSTFAPAATGVDSVPAGAAEIKAKLVERGLPEHVADGFVVNFADESGLNPGINEQNPTVPGSRGGYGLYQLTGPRRVAYEQFAKAKGVPYSDVDTQLDFLVSELKGPEAAAAEKIFSAPDSGTAAAAIAANFLRPNAKSLSERVAKYTAGVPSIPLGGAPVQVASLSPDAGMAEAMPMPAATPTMRDAAVAEVTQPQQAPVMALAPEEVVTPLAGVQPGQPMAQPPAQDVTQVPALSSGAGLSFQAPEPGTYATPAVAAAINQPALSPAVQQVSAALPIRQRADPNDIMVAGRDQTAQPQIPTGAASVAPARSGPTPQQLIAAMTDPRASPRTRQVAEVLYKQQAAQAQAQYEAQLQANDPKRQLEIQKLQREVNEPRKRNTATIGNTVVDLDTGKPIYEGQEKPTSTIQEYEYARQQGYTGDFVQFNLDQKKATATTIDLREPGGEGKKFYEKLDEGNAKIYSDLSQAGVQARSTQGMTKQLAERLKNAPQGAAGALAQLAGEWGIKTEGSSDIEAATALINRLVPQQRQPGSGTMSDADLELFKASLPRILNSKGGNEMIISDLNAISEYQIKMGEIADRVADRELTPSEGREEIRKLANPLSNFLERDRAEKLDEQDNGWKEISPGVKVRPIQ